MHVIPYVVAYAAVLVFLVAVVSRFIMFQKMPMHIRWELYPVAHEGKKSKYGGSYMEEFEWWKQPRHSDKIREAKAMSAEILFLVALKEHNKKMWARSFPFHFGLYLIIGCTVLMIVAGIVRALAPDVLAGGFGSIVQAVVAVLGAAGLVLGLYGALGLLQRRLNAADLKGYTSPADIFNLIFFLVAFGVAFVHFVAVDRDFSATGTFVGNLVSGQLAVLPAGGTAAAALLFSSVVLLSVLLAYIPMTHMSHFVGKYFAYHAVRWEDKPNTLGSGTAEKAGPLLGQPVGWAASHIGGADGKKTWLEAATENPAKEEE